jgi:sortase A
MAAGERATALVRLEATLVVIGAVCLGWYGGVRVAAAREQASLARELEVARGLPPKVDLRPEGRSYLVSGALVGRIEIPRLKLSAIAREGVDDRTLDLAVGHVPGTSFPGEAGNAAFAAHRDTFFRPLRHVQGGDVVIVTTPLGTHRYLVTSTRIVGPDDGSVLDATERPTLTLVTCYPFDFIGSAPNRFVVQAAELPSAVAAAPLRRDTSR